MGSIRREFNNIGNLIKEARKLKGISQADLSKELGYKNGQFVSNIERGLCSIPYEKIHLLAKVLDLHTLRIKDSIVSDVSQTIDAHIVGKKNTIFPDHAITPRVSVSTSVVR